MVSCIRAGLALALVLCLDPACALKVKLLSTASQELSNPFYDQKEDWDGFINEDVKNFVSIKKGFRKIFEKVFVWTEVAGVSMHMAIVSAMYGNLQAASRVVDLGSGTGALLAMFAEATPSEALVEGYEFDDLVAEKSQLNLERASQIFRREKKEGAAEVALRSSEDGIHGGEDDGDAFAFNKNGALDGSYDVINVGFAMESKDVPAVMWKALKEGGQIGLPLCDEPLKKEGDKCHAHYHIFTKDSSSEFPGIGQQDQKHTVISKDIKFIHISPS